MRLVILTLAVVVLSGCAATQDAPSTPSPSSNTSAPGETPAAVPVEVALHNDPGVGVPPTTMGIDPATLELSLGVPVNLTVTNRGTGVHNLVIEGLDIATDNIEAGASVSIEFTPMEAGTFAMYCSIGGDAPVGHRGQGMAGEVVVA